MSIEYWSEKLNIDDTTPLYIQLERIILKHIEVNRLKPGDIIPSEGDFCSHYKLSRSTVRQAFKRLEKKGLVIRRRGLGSFVSEPKVNRDMSRLYSFTSQLTEMGYDTSSKILEFKEIAADMELSERFDVEKGTPIIYIERIRLANGIPMLLEKTMIPKKFCPNLSLSLVEKQSLYKYLIQSGLEMDRAIESYEPKLMDKKTQRLLKCDANPCAFSICRKSYTINGELFEFTQSIMPGQRSRLEIKLHKDGIDMNKYE